jgi:hypothetical protein
MAGQPAALKRYWAARRAGGGAATTVIVAAPRKRAPAKRRATSKPKRRRHHRGGGGKISIVHLAAAGIGLAYIAGASGPKTLTDFAAKIPGAKTFGNPAIVGLACLAADKFVKPNKWLRLVGYAGVVLAAVEIGTKGTKFQWLGDDESSGDFDISDMGDDIGADMGDDDMGDDDMGDDE